MTKNLTLASADSRIQWSIAVCDLETGTTLLAERPDAQLDTASIAKILLLIEVSDQVEQGRLPIDEQLDRESGPRVEDSGLLYRLDVSHLSVNDLATLVGAVSDNWATNVLLERVGLMQVEAQARSIGLTQTAMNDFVRDERTAEHPRTLSQGTAAEWVAVLTRLRAGDVVSPNVCARVWEWLSNSMDYSMVTAALALDPLVNGRRQQSAFEVVNKTGTDMLVRGDVGVITKGTAGVVYACLANWSDPDPEIAAAALNRMTQLGAAIAAWLDEQS